MEDYEIIGQIEIPKVDLKANILEFYSLPF